MWQQLVILVILVLLLCTNMIVQKFLFPSNTPCFNIQGFQFLNPPTIIVFDGYIVGANGVRGQKGQKGDIGGKMICSRFHITL